MQLGIMSGTFPRGSLESRLDAIRDYGLSTVQFGLSCAGLPPMPEEIDPSDCDRIRLEMVQRQISMAALSGTYNMIHPDSAQREQGLRRLQVLSGAAVPKLYFVNSNIVVSKGDETPSVRADMWAEDYVRLDKPMDLILSSGLGPNYDPKTFSVDYPK